MSHCINLGLMPSTILDTIVTPVVFWLVGGKPLARLVGGGAPAGAPEGVAPVQQF